ncbi:proline dehydrogenase [Nephila pilipes]|uniref:Proline dehydrogenase n=1 Tax=Nephila pilipes TaxID=299642 RepID=A0A8X6UPF3_NEPPI|nr:proline dehydrogenase [Nephila pilipes]
MCSTHQGLCKMNHSSTFFCVAEKDSLHQLSAPQLLESPLKRREFLSLLASQEWKRLSTMHRWKVAYFRVPHRAHVISISSKHRASMPTRNRSTSLPPLTFEDHNRAFRHKSTWEIVRALAVLRACSLQPLVDNSLKLMKWVERTGGEACLRLLLKRTLYEQFVGGETPRELRQCVSKVSGAGMRCMLAATMEEDIGQERRAEEVYQGNCGRILEAIQLSSDTCPSPMIQLKLSGLLPARLLMQVGDLFSASKLRAVEAIGDQLVGNSIRAFQESLGRRDQVSLERALRRLKEICEEARRKNVRVLVDAECTHLNEGLSALAMGAAAAFNSDVPVVWNTYQCYLKVSIRRSKWNARAQSHREQTDSS